MDSVIIPKLKQGIYYRWNENSVEEVSDNKLTSNNFVQGLIKDRDGDVPLYKCDLNMLAIEDSAFN